MIHVRQLTKEYADLEHGKFAALGGVSFEASAGQIYGLLGPNGAGKTTVLRILSTVLRPTSGWASVAGFDCVTQSSQVRHHIGFMSANTGVYDRMTAWEMVEYFGRLYGIAPEPLAERMEALFTRLGMNDIRDVLGAKMSTGMRQKVSIARSIVHDPPVLIFDEATSGLDVLVARALLSTVSELRDQGKCIIFSTHIMREAEKLCDRIAIMHRGYILAEGTLDELRDRYREHDLEELFFRLIRQHDQQIDEPARRQRGVRDKAMNWTNVKLILAREVRDQLRDRRTLFMIAVLPLLLYPLLGMSFFQVAQFLREQPTRVLVIDLPAGSGLPPLVEDHHFAPELFVDNPQRAKLLRVDACTPPEVEAAAAESKAKPDCGTTPADIRYALDERRYDVVLVFPLDFAERLSAFREAMHKTAADASAAEAPRDGPATAAADDDALPGAELHYNSARETSQIARLRVGDVLAAWRGEIGRENLRQSGLPTTAAKPFRVVDQDAADSGHREIAVWSKILPFVLLLWALTGAFYPAVDLCAGEKERGTLETLLSSPAERSEIVWGKLLTIMLFSIATAVLNLISMGISGAFVMRHMPEFGPPPLLAIVWLLIALVPVSAMFSGLCLALAALARSSKEGQYYLMPLVLITMPLTILPMSPGVELNLGNSLIPLTGIVLLLRTLLEGNYALAALYAPPVVAVTLTCCLLAVRWAADQFNTESVLFRESERLDMGRWLRSLMRDREDTPSVAEALACGVLILMIHFFMSLSLPPMHGFRDFVSLALVSQLVVILTPSLLMTTMLTRSPAATLLLRRPPVLSVVAALLLAVAIHPLAFVLQTIVSQVYPVGDQVTEQLRELLGGEMPLGWLLLVVAVVPAVCEELAFRGFILSGLRHLGHRWRAIVLTSIFFGVTHPIFQQSLVACVVGVLLGFIAVQTGSILPGIIFHMVHNSLGVLLPTQLPTWLADHPHLAWLAKSTAAGDYHFTPLSLMLSAIASGLLLVWFQRLGYARTKEESLQEAIEHQAAPSAPL